MLQVSSTARLLICGQAPGLRVHDSGIPFNDPSGDRLRDWLGIDRNIFYDQSRVAIAPMGFCFPGYDARKADLPPRRECRKTWHDRLFVLMPQVELILLVGVYARDYHFDRLAISPRHKSMTETVKAWRGYLGGSPRLFPLPHPSWRNSGWLKRNPWFEAEALPQLRLLTTQLLNAGASGA